MATVLAPLGEVGGRLTRPPLAHEFVLEHGQHDGQADSDGERRKYEREAARRERRSRTGATIKRSLRRPTPTDDKARHLDQRVDPASGDACRLVPHAGDDAGGERRRDRTGERR